MEENKIDKIERVLGLYTKLMNGSLINKAEEANYYGVNERSIQRDIDDIRIFLNLILQIQDLVIMLYMIELPKVTDWSRCINLR